MLAIPNTIAPRVAALLPRLASEHDGEVIATARAIGRTLKAAGADWHDLAATIGQPRAVNRHPSDLRGTLHALREALELGSLTPWEADFVTSILDAARRPGWQPTPKQSDIINRLAAKARNTEATR